MSREKKKEIHVSIAEALNTLSSIADLGEKGASINIPVADLETIKPIARRVKRIQDVSKELSVDRMKEIFKVILNYVKDIYDQELQEGEDTTEGVRSIMVLVGEAAKKLDRYTDLFHTKSLKSVTQLNEYKRLQEFYTRKIEKQVDESLLSKWIFGLAKAGPTKETLRKARARKREKSRHVFVDLDMVKRDNEYELLLMRKEDGSRFFSPRLLRNIKLVCEFGSYSNNGDDIFERVYDWRDVMCHVASINMLHTLKLPLKRFYQEAFRYKNQDLIRALNKTIMALMLSANPDNLRVNKKNKEGKTCIHYFSDFQNYLREGLNTRYYQKLLVYPPKSKNILANCVLSVTQHLCRGVYLHMHIMQELFYRVHDILDEAKKSSSKSSISHHKKGIFIWSKLAYDYAEIVKSFKMHTNGPLKRILESLEEGRHTAYDSLLQFNLPHTWFDLYLGKERIINLRMASPTRQVLINKSVVLDEFKGFLLSQSQRGKPTNHLLINLQDRTSWREFSRCQALEQLQNTSQFGENLTVVTLPVDTMFYHQSGPYEAQDNTADFIKGFKDQLKSGSAGYFFPAEIKKELDSGFITDAMTGIHEFFFKGERFLSVKDRQSFITLFHFLLELKLIDIIHPFSFSLSCKDAIDIGGSASVLMFAFFKFLERAEMSNEEIDFIEAMIYGPSIFIRERAILPEPLNRMLAAMQVLEATSETLGFNRYQEKLLETFDSLFKGSVLNGKVHVPLIELERQISEAA